MKNLEKFPVAKNGKFLGYADADQIAKSAGKLELFDEHKAERIASEAKIAASKAEQAKAAEKVATAEGKGGADASAVKKGPAQAQ